MVVAYVYPVYSRLLRTGQKVDVTLITLQENLDKLN